MSEIFETQKATELVKYFRNTNLWYQCKFSLSLLTTTLWRVLDLQCGQKRTAFKTRQTVTPAILLWTVLCGILLSLEQKQLRPGQNKCLPKPDSYPKLQSRTKLRRGSTVNQWFSIVLWSWCTSPTRSSGTVHKGVKRMKTKAQK